MADKAKEKTGFDYGPIVLSAVQAGNRRPESIGAYALQQRPALGDEKQRDFATGIAAALKHHVEAKSVEYNNDTKEYV